MSYSIAIPSRGVNASLIRVLREAQLLGGVDEILIGINPDRSSPSSHLEPFLVDSRIKVFYHEKDIGLYGNFRFLLMQSTSEFFSWLCTDDHVSESTPALLLEIEKNFLNLAIPSWKWAEYYPETLSHSLSDAKPGHYPSISCPDSTLKSIIYCEPSWIFGIWRTNYLSSIFPKSDFDWLDTYLLQKVILTRKVAHINVQDPMIIGTWHWKSKIPSSVNGHSHNPYPAIFRQVLISPAISFLSIRAPRLIFQRCKSLVNQSKSMSERMKDGLSE
jgi:hypothetical protein